MKGEIYWIGPVLQGRLAVMPRPRGGDWLREEIDFFCGQGVDVVACLLERDESRALGLEDEGLLCTAAGIEFLSFPIRDHSVPEPDRRTTEFIRTIVGHLKLGKGVAVHCYMGIGRSVVIASSVMALAGHPVESAFAAISRARGYVVPETQEQREWVHAFAREQSAK